MSGSCCFACRQSQAREEKLAVLRVSVWAISRKANKPPSEDSRPPSKRAITALPCTGDRPGSNGVTSTMAGAAQLIRGFRPSTQTLHRINILCYIRQPSRIIRARWTSRNHHRCRPRHWSRHRARAGAYGPAHRCGRARSGQRRTHRVGSEREQRRHLSRGEDARCH